MVSLLLLLAACPTEAPEVGVGTPGAAPDGTAPPPTEASGGPGGASTVNTEPLNVVPGEGVKLTGTATYEGTAEGSVRMDVLKQAGGMPSLVYSTTLERLGPFEVELPKNFGSVQVTVFVDTTGDGPTVGEPMAASAFMEIGETPPAAVTLVLAKLESGSGGPPPPGAGGAAPPVGGPGAPGAPAGEGALPANGPAGDPPAGGGPGGPPPTGAAPVSAPAAAPAAAPG